MGEVRTVHSHRVVGDVVEIGGNRSGRANRRGQGIAQGTESGKRIAHGVEKIAVDSGCDTQNVVSERGEAVVAGPASLIRGDVIRVYGNPDFEDDLIADDKCIEVLAIGVEGVDD